MTRPLVVPLGGFLGAGKTTLILAAARVLQKHGKRAAVVLNDQGEDLVDTQLAVKHGLAAGEVTGGCFCCHFSDLIAAMENLRGQKPDVIFAEAVGSCTDISATTLQPLKRDYAGRFRLAPFSVLVDPARARELSAPGADPDLAFLFQTQVAEADLVCFTKSDVQPHPPELPDAHVRVLSAQTGQGVEEWLDEILAGELAAGGKILDLDYARYALAEAALVWLNCRAEVRLQSPLSPALLVGPSLDHLCERFAEAGIRIAHLKYMDDCPTGYVKASVVGNGLEPWVEGILDASPAAVHELCLNIRAVGKVPELERIVREVLAELSAEIDIRSLQCFHPAAPKPEIRLGTVV